MTRHERILRIDELTGESGAELVRFAMDGHELLLDLHPRNAEAFRQALAPYIAKVRPSVGRRRGDEIAAEVTGWKRATGLSAERIAVHAEARAIWLDSELVTDLDQPAPPGTRLVFGRH